LRSSLFFPAKLLLPTPEINSTPKIAIMSRDALSLLSPDAPSNHRIKANALNNAFDAMLLNPTTVSNDDFSDDWGAADTEDALTLSGVNDTRLKDCIVVASASVWGIPTMPPVQLKACFPLLLHPNCPNSLVVVHQTGGRKTHILCTLVVIKRGIVLIFIPLLILSADIMHKFESSNPTWRNVVVYHLDEIFHCN
jgi:hypothetical protein